MRFYILTKHAHLRTDATPDKKTRSAREAKGAPGHQFDPDMPADLFRAFNIPVLPKPTGRKSKIKP